MCIRDSIRDGSTIETLDKKKDDFSEQRIIQGMVGREMTDRDVYKRQV